MGRAGSDARFSEGVTLDCDDAGSHEAHKGNDSAVWREAPRFFLAPEAFDREPSGPGEFDSVAHRTVVWIRGDDAHHAARVLRLESGDRVVLLDGTGNEYRGVVECVKSDRSGSEVEVGRLSRTRSDAEPSFPVHVVQGLPKGDKLELVLQKGTEVGVTSFWPVYTERVVVSYTPQKLESRHVRWTRIVAEAAKQSRRAVVPEVAQPKTVVQTVRALSEEGHCVIVLWEKASAPLSTVLRRCQASGFPAKRGAGIALVVGPEGGLTEDEVASLCRIGAVSATLGPRILRTETAGIVAPALALYQLDTVSSEAT